MRPELGDYANSIEQIATKAASVDIFKNIGLRNYPYSCMELTLLNFLHFLM